jgi:hypothetical protein
MPGKSARRSVQPYYGALPNLVTPEQIGPLPESGDEGSTPLCGLALAAGDVGKCCDGIRTVVRQSVALKPGSQVFDGIDLWRKGRQERHLDVAIEAVD